MECKTTLKAQNGRVAHGMATGVVIWPVLFRRFSPGPVHWLDVYHVLVKIEKKYVPRPDEELENT